MLRLRQARVAAQPVARALAYEVELALERLSFDALAGRNEQLLDVRSRGTGAVPQVGCVGVGRDDAPAYELLAFLRADRSHGRFAALALRRIRRQEHDARGELARSRECLAERFLGDSRQELVRKSRNHARAVAGVRLGAAGAAVIHAAQKVVGVLDDPVAAFALDVRDEADTATVVLELGAIQPLGRREAGAMWFTHACRPHAARAPTTQRSVRARLGAPLRCRFVLVALAVMVFTAVGRLAPLAYVFSCWLAVALQDLSNRRPFDLPRRGPQLRGPEQALCRPETIGNGPTPRQSRTGTPPQSVRLPAIAHAVDGLDGVELRIDARKLGPDALDLRRHGAVVEHDVSCGH